MKLLGDLPDQGIYLVDKPPGWSSFQVVQWMRRQTGEKRVGHAGTLDPFATGLLIVAVGREFTRELSQFEGMDKIYETEIVLGRATDTLDPTGRCTFEDPQFRIDSHRLQTALQKWTGDIRQVPPAYSAIHIRGQRAYQLARAGQTVTMPPRDVTVYEIVLGTSTPLTPNPSPEGEGSYPVIKLRIRCSRGTYIRSIARDIAAELGTQGHCLSLRRMRIGSFDVDGAVIPR